MRYPKTLASGSLIAITAPSSGVEAPLHPRLDLAIADLRARGYDVVEGRCLRQSDRFGSGSPEERAADFMELYCREEVSAVYPPWGGDMAIDVLPLLDWDMLRKSPPKWVIGYSDTSTLLLPLTTTFDMATIHGINLMDAVPAQTDPLSLSLFEILEAEPGDIIKLHQSDRHQLEFADFKSDPEAPYHCVEPTEWKVLHGQRQARFSGRLIGGCIDTISCLTGTPYGRVNQFCERYKEDGIIFYFENCELTPTALYRSIRNLRQAGWLDRLHGVLVGRSTGPEGTDENSLSYLDALTATLGDLSVPVLYDVDIGHRPPQLSLVNGSMAIVKFANGQGELIQQLI